MIKVDYLLLIRPVSTHMTVPLNLANLNTPTRQKIETLEVSWQEITEYITHEYNYLLLMDFHAKDEAILYVNQQLYIHHNCYLVIYNSPLKVSSIELAPLANLRGLFYLTTSPKQITKGIEKLVAGKYALPKEIIESLFECYQSTIVHFGNPYALKLTPKEKNVLNTLKKGMSNFQLADALNLSEYTVKSHLYNIFKKIKVKNRYQAIVWAQKYLP